MNCLFSTRIPKLPRARSGDEASQLRAERAFTRLDMMVLIGLVALLLAWFGLGQIGERGRMARCAGNLAALGKAMHGYANEHDGALPIAGIDLGKVQSSWDMQVFPYLVPGLAKANDARLAEIVPRFFACSSEKVSRRGKVRSYAMAGNDMAPENWPPGPNSATGVGLRWDAQTVLSLLGAEAPKKPESLPTVKLSSIPAPADTVLLTEFIDPDNKLGGIRGVTVSGTAQQQQAFEDGGASFHHGKFNYLMADGHVERLSPLQTGSLDGTAGIWSIKKGN